MAYKILDHNRVTLISDKDSSSLHYIENFIDAKESLELMQELLAKLSWSQESIWMFGKKVLQPRLTAWLGKGLTAELKYSQSMPALPWWGRIHEIKEELEALCDSRFNAALLNYYRSGQDSMGLHSDDEPVLGESPTIAALTLGQERKFVWVHKDHPKKKGSVILANGSVVIMRGDFQKQWKHGLPKSKKNGAPRMNISFRFLKLLK